MTDRVKVLEEMVELINDGLFRERINLDDHLGNRPGSWSSGFSIQEQWDILNLRLNRKVGVTNEREELHR